MLVRYLQKNRSCEDLKSDNINRFFVPRAYETKNEHQDLANRR